MPRRVYRKKKAPAELLDFYKLACLFLGWRDPAKYPHLPRAQLGYYTHDDYRKGWDKHKNTLRVAKWLDVYGDWHPGWRPAAWWEFETTGRGRGQTQWQQLKELGALTEAEEIEYRRRESLRPAATLPVDKEKLAPIPAPSELPADLRAIIEKATERASAAPWFKWVPKDSAGNISIADADAILNGCTIDEQAGWHVCDFIESFCKSSELGEYLELQQWQSTGFLYQLFGWVRADGRRRFREAYTHVAKKNGKSTITAGVGCYGATLDGETHPRIYCTAVTEKQAEIVHGECAAMVSASPELSSILKVVDSELTIKLREQTRGKAEKELIIALAKGAASNEGWKTFYLISDELHAWTDRSMYNALKYGMKGRRNGLRIAITTAGDNKESIGGEKYEYARRIKAGQIFNLAFFALLYEIPDEVDIDKPEYYLNPEIWKMANPALGLTIDYEEFRDDLLTARGESEESWATFKRYNLNIWVGSQQPYIPMVAWAACSRVPIVEEDYFGKDCYSAADLASVQDIAALVHLFPRKNEEGELCADVLPRFFVPEDIVKGVSDKGFAPYDRWVREGHLIAIPGPFIDRRWIRQQIFDDAQRFRIKELVYDRRYAQEIMKDCFEAGILVAEFGQGFTSMNLPTKALLRMILSGRLNHGAHPVLTWMAGNAVSETSPTEEVKLVKRRRDRAEHKKIDGIIALIMALSRAIEDAPQKISCYAREGDDTVV